MTLAILIGVSLIIAYLLVLSIFKLFDHVIKQVICEEPNEWYAEEIEQSEAVRLEIEELKSRQ